MEKEYRQNNGFYDQEVVDLRQLLFSLIRYLPMALGGACLGFLLGLAISFSLPKRYQAVALLEIIPAPLQKVLDPLEGFQTQPGTSAPALAQGKGFGKTYETLVLSSGVIKLAKRKLSESVTKPADFDFNAKIIPQTQLLELQTTSLDAVTANAAVNAWADAIIEEFANQGAAIYQRGQGFLSEQYQRTKKEIDDLEAKIQFLQPKLEVKMAELNAKKPQLLDAIKELAEIGPEINSIRISMPALKEEIKKHDRALLQNNASIAGDKLNYQINISPQDLKAKEIRLVNYGIAPNPLYQDLEKRISNQEIQLATLVPRKEQLAGLIERLQREVDALQNFVNEKTLAKSQLERDLGIAKKSYDLVYGKMSEAQFASSLRIANLRVIGYAGDAKFINRRANFAYKSAAVGFMFGFLGLFLLSYLRKSARPPFPLASRFTRPEVSEVR